MNNVADKLYNILGTKFDNTDIKTLDSKGKETTDMEEIEMFSFDFLVNSKNYGPVVILLSANENLEVYYGDNTSKSLDRDAKKKWENLIEHLSTFARTNRLGFSLKHTSDLKYDLSNITDITESFRNIFEGYYGTRKTSYNKQGKAKIIIKHTRALGEDEKRFRNISSLFIENADGERFKLPFKKLAGARAMARHVTEGGNPYDLFGVHISEMVNDINTLGGFVRRSKMYEGNDDAMNMVETGRTHYNELRKGLSRIAGVRGYNTYKESWEPSEITTIDEDTDAIRKLFTEKKVNPRTEDALPLLARLQKMAEARDEMDQAEKIGHDEDDMPFDWDRNEVSYKDHPEHDEWERDLEQSEIDDDADLDEGRKKMSDKHQADSFAARHKWKKEVDAEEEKMKAAFADPKMTWAKYVKGDDLEESNAGRPTEVEIYKKIKDLSLIALKGYARRIKMDREVIDQHNADEDTLIDEIMGYLFDDDWEMKLIQAGAFNEVSEVELTKDNEMKEINEFEEWVEEIVEGTWSFPDNPKALDAVKEFMATEQPVGIDAINATDALYNILGNDRLFDQLGEIASDDPDADARSAVKNYIETMYRELDGYAEADQANIVNLYKAIGGDAIYPHEMEENADLDYDGDTTQLNASSNKHLDDYIQKEDVDADTYANSNVWNESDEEVSESSLSFGVDGNGPYNVMSSKGDIHDTYDSKEEAQSVATELNAKYKDKESVNESTDLNDLMLRTNFLLRK